MQQFIIGLGYTNEENPGYCFGIAQGIISNIYCRCQKNSDSSKSPIDIDGEDSAIQTMLFLNKKLQANSGDPVPIIEIMNFIQEYLHGDGDFPVYSSFSSSALKDLNTLGPFLFHHQSFKNDFSLSWQSLPDDEKIKSLINNTELHLSLSKNGKPALIDQKIKKAMKMQQDFITLNLRPSLQIEQDIKKLKMARAKTIVDSYNLFKQFVNIRIFLDGVFMFQEYD